MKALSFRTFYPYNGRQGSLRYLSAPRRYTTLQVGTPLIIIRDILGHVDLKSTEIYAKADLELKRQALAKASVHSPTVEVPSWQQNKTLIEWLRSL
jgi:hypothetical protein